MERDEWNALWADDEHGHHHHHQHDHDGPNPRHHHGSTDPDGLLVELADGLAAGRALELGCGLGSNAIWLAKQGWEVRAVDFSDVAIDQARQRAAKAGAEVEFGVADLRAHQPEGSFDLVTMFYLHLPVAERQAMLKRVVQVVAPGGKLVFVGHDRSDTEWLERHLHGPDEHGHDDGAALADDEARQQRRAELAATLSRPDEIAAELPGLEVERAEVVNHDAHGTGDEGATTVVVAVGRRG
ncbi:MAG: class I SAM-dependent methyltransferase [Deltaproteobacteria bacterium]|nr:class I SAM-dependent methyltransferase [Deltaproteobacteria bacterium]